MFNGDNLASYVGPPQTGNPSSQDRACAGFKKYEAIADLYTPGLWRVEAFGDDGEGYIVLFPEPLAEQRAREYADWKNQGDQQ